MMTSIGHGAYAENGNAVYIFPPKNSSIKRHIKKADEEGRLFDARAGRKTRSVLIAIKEKVITVTLTAVETDTLKDKVNGSKPHRKKKGALKNKVHSANSEGPFSDGIEGSAFMTKNS